MIRGRRPPARQYLAGELLEFRRQDQAASAAAGFYLDRAPARDLVTSIEDVFALDARFLVYRYGADGRRAFRRHPG